MAPKVKTAAKKSAAPAKKVVTKNVVVKKAAVKNAVATTSSGLNRASLVKAIAAEFELTQVQVDGVITSLFTRTTKALKKGEEVKIYPFGTFKVRKRAARPGRNPKTGERIRIKASKSVVFKAHAGMKNGV